MLEISLPIVELDFGNKYYNLKFLGGFRNVDQPSKNVDDWKNQGYTFYDFAVNTNGVYTYSYIIVFRASSNNILQIGCSLVGDQISMRWRSNYGWGSWHTIF